MSTYKIAFIGAGGRAVAYGWPYAEQDDMQVVAVADPQENHRELFFERTKISTEDVAIYDDWRGVLDNHLDEIDGLVISTPNHLHAEHAVPFLEKGLPVALEKPLATTKEDCEKILAAERRGGGRSLLGFVLRSTPFYSKIYELCVGGAIGQVMSIQADELPGLGVTSIMNRGHWRRLQRTSGGAMLEKSCHDMDVLNYLTDSRPVSLNSYGGRRVIPPNPILPDKCDGCPIEKTCMYYKAPPASAHEDQAEALFSKYTREADSCIFNIDHDTADLQSVQIEYESGAVVNFMLNFHAFGPKASRNFHAVGLRGQVWGNLHEAKVYHYDNLTEKTTEHDCSGDGSGHGGGDRLHALQLKRMMAEPDFYPQADAAAGYLSAVMCFAADRSMQEHRRVYFHYKADGLIDLA